MAALGLFLTFLVLVAACESFYLQTRNPVATLTVSNGGKWGVWLGVSFCPQGSFAVGYNVKVEADQFTGDDTALNAIILRCGDQSGHHFVSEIKSNNGEWGQWQDLVMCNTYINGSNAHDFIVGFQLKVEQNQNSGDDTAANDFNAQCRNIDSGIEYEITQSKHPGLWGHFGLWSQSCPENTAVCGIEARVEPSVGQGDDTSLNDVKLYCCGMYEG